MADNEGSGADSPEPSSPPPAKKLPYKTPVLKVYGSVRRLTNAVSTGGFGDGSGMMNASG
jgi:hypothetical protein